MNRLKIIIIIFTLSIGAIPMLAYGAPSIISSSAIDSNSDGYLDRITLVFSEPLSSVSNPNPAAFTLVDKNGLFLSVDMVTINGSNATILVNNTLIGTTGAPVLSYVAGMTPELKNIAGIPLTSFSLNVADHAPPIIKNVNISHPVNSDGNLQKGVILSVLFSEHIPEDPFVITDDRRMAFTYNGTMNANFPDGAKVVYGFGENLIKNSSFEESTVNAVAPDGWVFVNNAHERLNNNSLAHIGNHAISANIDGTTISNSQIPLQPGKQYILSAWVYDNLSGGNAYIDLNRVGFGCRLNNLELIDIPQWTHVRCTFTATAGMARVRFVTENLIQGFIYIDDLRVEEASNSNLTKYTLNFISPTTSGAWTENATFTGFRGIQDLAGNSLVQRSIIIDGINRINSYPIFEKYKNIIDINGNEINGAFPKFADLDNDGDFDMTIFRKISTGEGHTYYYENTGSSEHPVWTGGLTKGPLNNEWVKDGALIHSNGMKFNWGWQGLTFFDTDNDGDLDIFSGAYIAINNGTVETPSWGAWTLITWTLSDGTEVNVGGGSSNFIDIDKDGDMDLLRLAYPEGTWLSEKAIIFYENISSDPALPEYTFYTEKGDNINGYYVKVDTANLRAPWSYVVDSNGDYIYALSISFVDIDNDRDLDLIAYRMKATVPEMRYYRNDDSTIDKSHPVFTPVADDNPWVSNYKIKDRYGNFIDNGYINMVDLDNDGDDDIISYVPPGCQFCANSSLRFYENRADDNNGPSGGNGNILTPQPPIKILSSGNCTSDSTGSDATIYLSSENPPASGWDMKISNYLTFPTQESKYPDPLDSIATSWQPFSLSGVVDQGTGNEIMQRQWKLPSYPGSTNLKVYVNFRDQNGFRSPRYFDNIIFYEPSIVNTFIPFPGDGLYVNDTRQDISLSVSYSGGIQSPADFRLQIINTHSLVDTYNFDLNSSALTWDSNNSVLTFIPENAGVTFKEGKLNVKVTGYDKCGNLIKDNNSNSFYSWIFYLDTTVPVSNIITAGDFNVDNWNSLVAVYGTATDPLLINGDKGSGIDTVEVAIIKDSTGEYWSSEKYSWLSTENWELRTYYESISSSWGYKLFQPSVLEWLSLISNGDTFTIKAHAIDKAGNKQIPDITSSIVWDNIPPDAPVITNSVVLSPDSVEFKWNIPNSNGGELDIYSIKYTEGNFDLWSSAVDVNGEPQPGLPGTSQSYIISGLKSDTLYCFAMKVSDRAGNESAQSNSMCTITRVDITAPGVITNLAVNFVTSSGVKLNWTAPGDDGSVGQASKYDIRYSTAPIISDSDFLIAKEFTNLILPKQSGVQEVLNITGLSSGVTYYFVIKTYDEVPNISVLSNTISITTDSLDNISPGGITDLQVLVDPAELYLLPESLTLKWTAPGDDWVDLDANGQVNKDEEIGNGKLYDIRYSLLEIIEDGSIPLKNQINFSNANMVASPPSPASLGTEQTNKVLKLETNTLYWFAIKTVDENGNISKISNIPFQRTSMYNGDNMVTVSKLLPKDDRPLNVFGSVVTPVEIKSWVSLWDGTANPGITEFGAWTTPDRIIPGQAYYLSVQDDYTVMDPNKVNGGGAETEYTILRLIKGWNLIGNPYKNNVELKNIKILPQTGGNWRRRITITNTSTSSILHGKGLNNISGHTVSIKFDHSVLVKNGKSLASGNDVKILYCQDIACGNYYEADRIVMAPDCPSDGSAPNASTGWNCSNTEVFFATQKDIPGGTSNRDQNYFIEYGNVSGSLELPKEDKSNIYVFYDDFDYNSNMDLLKYGNNLLANPGFESNLYGWQEVGGVVSIDPANIIKGDRSVHISSSLPYNASIGVSQDVTLLTPGVMYTFSGWIKTSLTGGNAYLGIHDGVNFLLQLPIPNNQGWMRLNGQFIAPANGKVSAGCFADISPVGDIWCDGLKIEKGSVATAFEDKGWKWWKVKYDNALMQDDVENRFSVENRKGWLQLLNKNAESGSSLVVHRGTNVNEAPIIYIQLDDNDYIIETKEDVSGMLFPEKPCQTSISHQGLTFIRNTKKEGFCANTFYCDNYETTQLYMQGLGDNWHNKGYFGTWANSSINPSFTKLDVAFDVDSHYGVYDYNDQPLDKDNTSSTQMEHYLRFLKLNSGISGQSKIEYLFSLDGQTWNKAGEYIFEGFDNINIINGQNDPSVPSYYGLIAKVSKSACGGPSSRAPAKFSAYFDYFKVKRFIDSEPNTIVSSVEEPVGGISYAQAAVESPQKVGFSMFYFKNTSSAYEFWNYTDAILRPWRGYWIFAYNDLWIKICRPDNTLCMSP